MMGTSAVMSTIRLPRGYKRLKAACRVPATTANLGPGFDSVGLALTLHNELAAEVGKTNKTVVEITGEGQEVLAATSPISWSVRCLKLSSSSNVSQPCLGSLHQSHPPFTWTGKQLGRRRGRSLPCQ